MPGLRDLLKKKEKLDAEPAPERTSGEQSLAPPIPEFTFVRTTTNTQEIISPPTYPGDNLPPPKSPTLAPNDKSPGRARRLSSLLHRPKTPQNSTEAVSPSTSPSRATLGSPQRPKFEKRRSSALGIRRNRSSTLPSEHVPENLPDAPLAVTITPDNSNNAEDDKERQAAAEARWEKRATLLAETQSRSRSRSISTAGSDRGTNNQPPSIDGAANGTRRPSHTRKASDQQEDVDIQEAIRLHDSGELDKATGMFRKLADPNGLNNALGQVLYGLALLHGWGIEQDREAGLTYLSLAAKNAGAIEAAALSSGAKSGGAAKGELVLAIFEMAQCFRNGWGTAIDKNAARQYYETAANLGDTDAMREAAWCYLEGFGGPKDKWKAAQYLRKAEAKGKKEVGDTWIWKDKYNPDAKHKEK